MNKLITLKKVTDTDSSTSINDEITDKNHISDEYLYHHNWEEKIDHTLDENGINLVNTEKEMDFTSINSINETNHISMKHNEK